MLRTWAEIFYDMVLERMDTDEKFKLNCATYMIVCFAFGGMKLPIYLNDIFIELRKQADQLFEQERKTLC